MIGGFESAECLIQPTVKPGRANAQPLTIVDLNGLTTYATPGLAPGILVSADDLADRLPERFLVVLL